MGVGMEREKIWNPPNIPDGDIITMVSYRRSVATEYDGGVCKPVDCLQYLERHSLCKRGSSASKSRFGATSAVVLEERFLKILMARGIAQFKLSCGTISVSPWGSQRQGGTPLWGAQFFRTQITPCIHGVYVDGRTYLSIATPMPLHSPV